MVSSAGDALVREAAGRVELVERDVGPVPVTLGEGLPALDRWRIIGNAVPPVLGEAVGRAVLDALWRAGLAPAPPAAPAAPGAPAQPVFVSPARRFRRLK